MSNQLAIDMDSVKKIEFQNLFIENMNYAFNISGTSATPSKEVNVFGGHVTGKNALLFDLSANANMCNFKDMFVGGASNVTIFRDANIDTTRPNTFTNIKSTVTALGNYATPWYYKTSATVTNKFYNVPNASLEPTNNATQIPLMTCDTGGISPAGTTRYSTITGRLQLSASSLPAPRIQLVIPKAGYLKNLRVDATGATSNDSIVVVMVGSTPSSITVTIPAGATRWC